MINFCKILHCTFPFYKCYEADICFMILKHKEVRHHPTLQFVVNIKSNLTLDNFIHLIVKGVF